MSSRCTTIDPPAGDRRRRADRRLERPLPDRAAAARVEREDLAEAGGHVEHAARLGEAAAERRVRDLLRRAPGCGAQATCPPRVTAVSWPAASIAKTRPPATIGPVSSRARLALPAPMSTAQISCGTGRSAGWTSRPPDAPLRCVQSAFTTAGGSASGRPRAAAGGRLLLRAHRDALAGQDRVPLGAGRERERARRAQGRERGRARVAPIASVARSAVGRSRPAGSVAAGGDDELARPRRAAPRWRRARRAPPRDRRSPPRSSPASRCISARCSSASGRNGAPGAASELERRLPLARPSIAGPSSITRCSAASAAVELARTAPSPATSPRIAAAASVSPASARAARLGEPREHRRVRRVAAATSREQPRRGSPGRSRHRRRAARRPRPAPTACGPCSLRHSLNAGAADDQHDQRAPISQP